jgi:hypothetical protein
MEREANRKAMIEQTQLQNSQTQVQNSPISRVVRTAPRRSFAGPEIKLLIGMGSVVATLAFWSLFSNRDGVLALASQASQTNASQANTQVVLAPAAADPAPAQQLRFVTAPAASSNTTVKAPPAVTINRTSNRTRVAPVTTTSSSRP